MLHNFPVALVSKKEIAENTVEMVFHISEPSFAFTAGQYVSVEIPALSELTVPERCHNFSIASSPSSPQDIALAFRVSASPFKTAILDLPVGGIVTINGPKGVFTLPAVSDTPLVFVAGGIGVTPFLSMIRYATETLSSQNIKLFYFNTKESAAPYLEELRALSEKNPHFTMEELWGIPQKDSFAPYVSEFRAADWYIVGVPAMVEKVQDILREFDIMDERVRTEEFSGYASH